MDIGVRWNRIQDELALPVGVYVLQENVVVCHACNGKQIRTVTTQGIRRHNESQRHQNAVLMNAAQNQWEHIQNELQLPQDIYTYAENVVFCRCCNCRLHSVTLSHMREHINTTKHLEAEERWRTVPEPSADAWARCTARQNGYWMGTTESMIGSENALNKLRNRTWREYQEKWTRLKLPDPSTLRRSYVPQTYQGILQRIRNEVGDHPIHLSVDETTDKSGRTVANAVVTPLFPDHAGIPRVFHLEELVEANAETICDFVNTCLNLLWSNGIRYDKVLIYATDAATYMVLSAFQLKNQHNYAKLVHVTCLCHGLNRVAEAVRAEYQNANKIIASTKRVFKKAPIRVQMFHDVAEGVPLPPEPILTRWGTWLEASIYYHENFEAVRNVIEELEDNAACVHRAKRYFRIPGIEEDFDSISTKFQCVADTITCLKTRGLPLNEALEIIHNIYYQLITDDDIPNNITVKTIRIFERNQGFHTMIDVADCLQSGVFEQLPAGWTIEDVRACCFAPLTSVEVERSFSRYKSIFRNNRRSFLFKNLRAHVIVACFIGNT